MDHICSMSYIVETRLKRSKKRMWHLLIFQRRMIGLTELFCGTS